MTTADPLLTREQLYAKLYDAASIMEIKRDVAAGFVILLSGGQPSANSSSDNNETDGLALAFMSLTSGNVIDACFGVQNPSRRGDTPAIRSAREAKALLDDCDTTDSFRQIAVDAYCGAFEAVVNYNEETEKLNCLTKCFRSKNIRNEAEEKISAAFDSLVTAMADSN